MRHKEAASKLVMLHTLLCLLMATCRWLPSYGQISLGSCLRKTTRNQTGSILRLTDIAGTRSMQHPSHHPCWKSSSTQRKELPPCHRRESESSGEFTLQRLPFLCFGICWKVCMMIIQFAFMVPLILFLSILNYNFLSCGAFLAKLLKRL